jgi:hypothetical protein
MEGNGDHGLVVRRDGFVWLRDSEIVGNCEPIGNPECSDGVTVNNASLDLIRSSISKNRNGIVADVGSNVTLRGTRTGSTEIYNNSVVGVQVALHSVVDLTGDTRIYGNGVDGRNGLYALQDSAIRISTPNVTVTDYIFCEDWESSLAIRPEFDPVKTNCTGF